MHVNVGNYTTVLLNTTTGVSSNQMSLFSTTVLLHFLAQSRMCSLINSVHGLTYP